MAEEDRTISELPLDDTINPDDMFEKETAAGTSKRTSGAALLALAEESGIKTDGMSLTLFLTGNDSDLIGHKALSLVADDSTADDNFISTESPTLNPATNDQLVVSFVTPILVPHSYWIYRGTQRISLSAKRSTGMAPTTLYAKMYQVSADGSSEILLATSEIFTIDGILDTAVDTNFDTFIGQFNMTSRLVDGEWNPGEEQFLNPDDRLALKIYANVGAGSGGEVSIGVDQGWNSFLVHVDSHIITSAINEQRIINSELLTLYAEYDGVTPHVGKLVRNQNYLAAWGFNDSFVLSTGDDQLFSTLTTQSDFHIFRHYGEQGYYNGISINLAIEKIYPDSDRVVTTYAKVYRNDELWLTTNTLPIDPEGYPIQLTSTFDRQAYGGEKDRIKVEIYINVSAGSDGSINITGNNTFILLNVNGTSKMFNSIPPQDGISVKYYPTLNDADVSGYKLLSIISPEDDSLLSPTVINDSQNEMYSFITPLNALSLKYSLPGMYHTRFWLKRETVTYDTWVYATLYKRNSAGEEDELSYSQSSQLTDEYRLVNFYFIIEDFVPLATDGSDRFVLKIFASTLTPGSDGTVSLLIDSASGIEFQVETNLITERLLPDGATDNQVIRADGVTGKIQDSLVTIDDDGSIDIPEDQTYNINGVPHTHEGGGGEGVSIWPEGSLVNGKIQVTVASGNLTLAIKTLAGADPSSGDPVEIVIGGVKRTIIAALSITRNAATNWCNAGSAELATKEIDWFPYLGYNSTDGIVIGFSRIPYAERYADFHTTNTDEKHAAISTITNAAADDPYRVIGRFAATLSAGAGYTWSVPTYNNSNLIQRPIYETRWLSYSSVIAPASGSFTSLGTVNTLYQVVSRNMHFQIDITIIENGTAGTNVGATLPFSSVHTREQNYIGRETVMAGFFLGIIHQSVNKLDLFNFSIGYPGGNNYRLVTNGVTRLV